MAWLRQLAYNIFPAQPANRVIEVSIDNYLSRATYKREECLILYAPATVDGNYEIVLQRSYNETTTKACSLYRYQSRESAELGFIRFADKVPALVSIANDTTVAYLQRICDTITEHPCWNIAHIAVHLQLIDILTDPKIVDNFHCEDTHEGISPLQLAVTTENVRIIKILLANGAPVDHFDYKANSTLHYAASTNKKIVSLITEVSKNTLNSKNERGQSPLHVACAKDKRDCVIALLEAGADVNISAGTGGGGGGGEMVGNVLQQFPGKLDQEDIKYGGTPLHWACSQEVIEALIEKKCDINCLNFHGQTALHMMVLRGRFECVVSLLSHGADTSIRDGDNKTPLQIAVQKLDAQSVKALVVFNASLNDLTEESHSLRHGIPCGEIVGDEVLFILHSVGVKRCGPDVRGCSPGCSAVDTYNGVAPPIPASSPSRDTLNLILEEATLPRNSTNYGRLLALDGGGIRGLILVVALMELEKAVGKPIVHCFDWIAGTSTGGILALAIASGKTLQDCLRLYFKLKSVVFVGSRPYPSEPLERILKEAFGDNTTMTDIPHPKLMIAATLVDRQPVDLHFFRNYPSPSNILEQIPTTGTRWPDPDPAPLQKLWEAARATGAAPTYFNAAGRFIDGGLISNNPTLDAMTEIHEYNISLKAMGRHEEVTPLSIVVSLGTGSVPRTCNEDALGFLQRWGNISQLLSVTMGLSNVRAVGQIINMLVDQATQADGRVVDRARAWCSSVGVPFFRFSPLLSKEIALNETQNDKLIHMMYETRAYMHAKMIDLENLVAILRQPVTYFP